MAKVVRQSCHYISKCRVGVSICYYVIYIPASLQIRVDQKWTPAVRILEYFEILDHCFSKFVERGCVVWSTR